MNCVWGCLLTTDFISPKFWELRDVNRSKVWSNSLSYHHCNYSFFPFHTPFFRKGSFSSCSLCEVTLLQLSLLMKALYIRPLSVLLGEPWSHTVLPPPPQQDYLKHMNQQVHSVLRLPSSDVAEGGGGFVILITPSKPFDVYFGPQP